MQVLVERGAGLDVHKKTVVACWFDGHEPTLRPVKRTFGTFRHQLEQLRDWLLQWGCTHVAMESTGVYWKTVHAVLESNFEVILGNARHMANVPGRKTDMNDAEWIATLLRYGLIRPNFIPPKPVRDLRELTRYRRKLVQTTTAAQLRVDKVLESASIKLSSVASEVFGVSGRRMLRALADGVTDAHALAELSLGKLRAKRDRLIEAFSGNFAPEHARLLAVQLDTIDRLERSTREVECLINEKASPFEKWIAQLDSIPGVNRTVAIDVLAESGTDMSRWLTHRHFAAWAGLCPGNRESAGRHRKTRTREGNPFLKSILVQAATSARKRRSSYLARRFATVCGRRGERIATVAIAHQIAVSIYYMILRDQPYREPEEANPQRRREQRKAQLLRQLQNLGYQVMIT
jgi:transposase